MTVENQQSPGKERREKTHRSQRRPERVLDRSEREIPDMEQRRDSQETEWGAPDTEERGRSQRPGCGGPDTVKGGGSQESEMERGPGELEDLPLFDGEQEDQEQPDDCEEGVERACVLIREAASLENFHKLDDVESAESMLARGRGGGEVADIGLMLDGDGGGALRFEEGKLQIETGYVMHFVEDDFTDLPIYDIINIPDIPCYSVSQSALESLPAWAQTKLEQQGHLKCSGEYDRTSKEFREIRPGWDDQARSGADVLAEMIEEYDGELLARPVYYFLSQYASDEYADPGAIAELRGIQESSVESEIRKASEQLDAE